MTARVVWGVMGGGTPSGRPNQDRNRPAVPAASEVARERQQWIEEFEAAARRPLEVRMRYAFIKTYKPVLDDAAFRAFATMADYRDWCERELPSWLGFGRE